MMNCSAHNQNEPDLLSGAMYTAVLFPAVLIGLCLLAAYALGRSDAQRLPDPEASDLDHPRAA